MKHIDRKKNADDIEDYFFDNYKDTGLEDVYTCTVYNARSQRRMFFGNVILTFDTEANAKVFILRLFVHISHTVFLLQKFLEMKLKNEEKMTWKRKLVRHTLAEVQKRRSTVSNRSHFLMDCLVLGRIVPPLSYPTLEMVSTMQRL